MFSLFNIFSFKSVLPPVATLPASEGETSDSAIGNESNHDTVQSSGWCNLQRIHNYILLTK